MTIKQKVARVNELIDRALELQDDGKFAEADALLDEAEGLLPS
jgi:hypothetical protein